MKNVFWHFREGFHHNNFIKSLFYAVFLLSVDLPKNDRELLLGFQCLLAFTFFKICVLSKK